MEGLADPARPTDGARTSVERAPLTLGIPFSISGCAALIYQIVWQRVLFASFGVNIESVTVIVSVFMFGLGIGALVGGALSRRYPRRLVQLFLGCELAIGIFGAGSIPLMHGVARLTLHGSLPTIALTAYALLSLPTICMGATLPLLVTLINRHYVNVGRTVAALYFLNTAGSAFACFLTVDFLFVAGGLRAAVAFACGCNLVVGALVCFHIWRASSAARDRSAERPGKLLSILALSVLLGAAVRFSVPPELLAGLLVLLGAAWWITRRGAREPENETAPVTVATLLPEEAGRARFLFVLFLSAAVGYVALSQEIVWFRLIGYMTGGRPDVFGRVLGFLLGGIALGSITTSRLYVRARALVLPFVAVMLVVSGALLYASISAIAALATRSGGLALGLAYGSVLLVALSGGSIFPALCHYGAESGALVGARVSWVYFANIVGSTAGPILTGFVLLEVCTLEQVVLCLSLGTWALAAAAWVACPVSTRVRTTVTVALAAGMAGVALVHGAAFDRVLEKLHYKTGYAARGAYKYLVQNRSGIVAVEKGPSDIVYGGGVYDGTFNVDPLSDTNGIHRGYMLAALHAAPRDVLEIGLSSGSWARVIASHAGVKHLTVVEINPAYTELIARDAEAAPLLSDPKVVIHYDDGRRWLERNPDPKFDFILMNMTFHWRDHATNLLSEEFLRLCRAHLREGGVMYYNSTASPDVAYTAARVFEHVTHYEHFVAASDHPFSRSTDEKRRSLLEFERAGRPVFAEGDPDRRALLESLANAPLPEEGSSLRAAPGRLCITDDNMATEFKDAWWR